MRIRWSKTAALWTAVVVSGALLAGCGDSQSAKDDDSDVVKVAGLTFTTGKFSTFGKDVERGMLLAESKIKDDGGVLGGKTFELKIQDTASEATQAVSLLRQVATDSNYVGVVGPTGTPDLLAVMPIADQVKIPLVSLGSQAALSQDDFSDWVTRVGLVETSDLLASYVTRVGDEEKISSIAVLHDRANDYAEAETKSLLKALPRTAVELVGDETYQAGDTDFASQIDAILRDKPDAIWIGGVTTEAARIMEQARARGFTGAFVGGAGLNDPAIGKLAGKAATGYVTLSPMNLSSDRPEVQDFVRRHKAKYGAKTPASTYTAYGYDATMLLAAAINKAGSTDRKAVMSALKSIKDVELVTGSYTFDGPGDSATREPFISKMSAAGVLEPLS